MFDAQDIAMNLRGSFDWPVGVITSKRNKRWSPNLERTQYLYNKIIFTSFQRIRRKAGTLPVNFSLNRTPSIFQYY